MNDAITRWDAPCDAFQSPVHLPEDWLGVEPRRPNWRGDLVCERCGWPKSAHAGHESTPAPESRNRDAAHTR